ncbi:Fels-1 Prophage Protein-like [Serratia quinivorans]|uniref:YcgJ family protein n=1 Tax=Serratia quinivorans TaxID=137545 RepID=UPI00217833AC|nr:YcgJ family protein [Serratia quinivorans]CAI1853717.1 Fels-1 Prophage Protein-like [Serratia quinivorans]
MEKIFLMIVLLGLSTSTFAAAVFSPNKGVVCDKVSNFCVDNQGISMGLTTKYLGRQAQKKLTMIIGDSINVNLWEYTLSNGVHCDSHKKQCYSDRYYPRTKDKNESTWTPQIFGNTR